MTITVSDLNSAEKRVLQSLHDGSPVDFQGAGTADEAAMQGWGDGRVIRAEILRQLILGRLVENPDPAGFQIRGARITGGLDLQAVSSQLPITLWACYIPDGIILADSKLRALSLGECKTKLLILQGAQLGALGLNMTTIKNDSDTALNAENMRVEQSFNLVGSIISGAGPMGAVYLTGATIGGRLSGMEATMFNPTGPAMVAEGLSVRGGVSLAGLKAVGEGNIGALRISADIGGQLVLNNAVLNNSSGPALVGEGLHVKLGFFMREMTATGEGQFGTVRLNGAKVDGQLNMADATVTNKSGPAVLADAIQVGDSVSLDNRFVARGNSTSGAVRFASAQIGGQFSFAYARITNESGPGLNLDRMRLTDDLRLDNKTDITGAGPDGALRLTGAEIKGHLMADGATIRNSSGPAIEADSLRAGEGILLRNGFQAVGDNELEAAICMVNAQISGPLELVGASITNKAGTALLLDGAKISGDLELMDGFSAVGSDNTVTVRLFAVQVGGRLLLDPLSAKTQTGKPGTFLLEGLTYTGLPIIPPVDGWLDLLSKQTPAYSAQPYRQIAAASQAAGHDGDTRKILMAQRRSQIHRNAITGKAERFWARVTGKTLGFGYQPWRALLILFGIALFAIVTAIIGGEFCGLKHTKSSEAPGSPCSYVERIGVGLDFSVPLVKTGAREACTTSSTPLGTSLMVAGWFFQVAGWATTTLFVAGFTGAVRKT